MIQLPVIQSPGDEPLRRSLQALELYDEQLGEVHQLEAGRVVLSQELADLPPANQASSWNGDWPAIKAFFDARKLICRQLRPSPGLELDPSTRATLEELGYQLQVRQVWGLATSVAQAAQAAGEPAAGLIPGRAAYRSRAALLMEANDTPARQTAWRKAGELWLDDHRVESLVWLDGGRAAGFVDLVIQSQAACLVQDRIPDPTTARQLLSGALDVAFRSRVRQMTLMTLSAEPLGSAALLTQAGFVVLQKWFEWIFPPV